MYGLFIKCVIIKLAVGCPLPDGSTLSLDIVFLYNLYNLYERTHRAVAASSRRPLPVGHRANGYFNAYVLNEWSLSILILPDFDIACLLRRIVIYNKL